MNPRLKRRLTDLVLHPAMLALPVAVLFILLLPDIFEKYTLELIREKETEAGASIEYHDLNHDGVSEHLFVAPDGVGGSGIAVYTNQNMPLYHPTFKGRFPGKYAKCMVGDYDHDGNDEFFAFTIEGDQLLIHAISHKERGKFIFQNRLVTHINPYHDTIHIMVAPYGFADLTGDGFEEVIFQAFNGYGVFPRKVFALDVKNDTLFSSPQLGGLGGISDSADIDRDGKPEFAITNYGPGNITDSNALMKDNCSYLLVLDDNLQFRFPPLVNPGLYSSVQSYFIQEGGEYLVLSYWRDTAQTDEPVPLRIFDKDGKFRENRYLKGDQLFKIQGIRKVYGKNHRVFFLKLNEGEPLGVYNQDLTFKRTIKPRAGLGDFYDFDFDYDGEMEMFYRTSMTDKWIILRNTFNHPVELEIPSLKSAPVPKFFHILNGKGKPYFCIQSGELHYIYQYGFNPLYSLRYPVYLIIYLLVFGFVRLVQYLQKIQLQKKEELRKKLAELQLNTLHNQMDSHFTFNVLNTIGAAIIQEQKEVAYNLLGRFSRLVRSTLSDSEMVSRPLTDELEFVENFIEIQKNRFKNLFDCHIHIDPGVDMHRLIPKGCIYTHVENAIKHAFTPKVSGGLLEIHILKAGEHLEIIIRDNGVGRAEALKNNTLSTKQGIKIMQQYYDILIRENKEPITETISDLYSDDGKPAGTQVVIRIPDGFILPYTPKQRKDQENIPGSK